VAKCFTMWTWMKFEMDFLDEKCILKN